MAKVKKEIFCDFCKEVRNPRFKIVNNKTDEVLRRMCKQCASNIDNALKFMLACERRQATSRDFIQEEDIPF